LVKRERFKRFSTQKKLDFYIFFDFLRNFFAGKFVVIGFKQGKSLTMGEKKNAATLGFGKSR
jgi:hypothetical protein